MNSTRLVVLAAAIALAVSCGARTPLAVVDEGVDGSVVRDGGSLPDRATVDVWKPNVVSPPRCGVTVPVGGIRFTRPRILGQVAIAPDGSIFAPRRTGDRDSPREVVAFDACGKELWSRGDFGPQVTGYPLVARLSWNDSVVVTTGPGATSTEGPFRFTRDGAPLPPFALGRGVGAFVGMPRGDGAAIVTVDDEGLLTELSVFDLSGAVITTFADFRNDTSCAVKGRIVGCFDRGIDLDARKVLWSLPIELIDGTYRHATPSAIAGGRIYTGVFGISTFQLVARELSTGRQVFRTTLLQSSSGQKDMLFGAPVVDAAGTIFVYVSAHEGGSARGKLSAVRPDGTVAWTYAATTPRERFFEHGTHVAGNGDVVYLAIGSMLHAIDQSGRLRWSTPIPVTSTASPVISPNGDLALHTDDDQLVVVATESAGVANSEWPALGGDERNANTRD